MKLSEYFKQQHSQEMPAHLKSELFSRIQKEKNWIEISTKIPAKIFFFASKRIMYTSLAAILVFVVFWWVLLDRTQVVDFGIFSVKQNNTPNIVLADYVAEIVEFNGEYSLERDWKVIKSDKLKTIQDWDIVSLPEWTDLIFNLQDWTQAKIIWPAEFSIEKSEKWYQISLFDGKFFRIYSPECKSDMEIITPDFSISQEKDQTLDIHIAKEENGEMLVKNEWDKVTVKTKNSENKIEVKQMSSELVAINPDSDKINIVEDEEVMLNFMAKNNISATFTLSTEDVEWPTIKSENQNNLVVMQSEPTNKQPIQNVKSGDAEIMIKDNIDDNMPQNVEEDPLLEWLKEVMTSDAAEIWEIDENITSQLWLSIENSQKVPTTSQMETLKANLNSFFLMNLFEGIYTQNKTDQNISRFADRVNSISSAFGYSYRASSDLSSIKSTVQTLKSQLEKDYYISPSDVLQLEKIGNWCDELKNPSKSDWESLKSDLPVNLKLM